MAKVAPTAYETRRCLCKTFCPTRLNEGEIHVQADQEVKSLLSGLASTVERFQANPYDFLFESDLQAMLFSRLSEHDSPSLWGKSVCLDLALPPTSRLPPVSSVASSGRFA